MEERQTVWSTKQKISTPALKESFGYKVNSVRKPQKYLGQEIINAFNKMGWWSRYGQPRLQPRAGGLDPTMCGTKDKVVKPYKSRTFQEIEAEKRAMQRALTRNTNAELRNSLRSYRNNAA